MKVQGNDYTSYLGRAIVLSLLLLFCPSAWPQAAAAKPAAGSAKSAVTEESPETLPEAPKDTIGRSTPRGTVLGLLSAARKHNAELAALYMNTPLRGPEAADLARQLAVVIDRGLPAKLEQISDKPEGSVPDPLKPDEDLIGKIETAHGDLDIRVERVDRGKAGKVWLFSRQTLDSIPSAFQELNTNAPEKILPNFMVATRVADIPLFQWLAVFVGMPFLYLLTGLLNRIIGLAAGALWRRLSGNAERQNPEVLSPPIRLVLLALVIRWLVSEIPLPLLARQFWSTAALLIIVVACTWLLMILNGWGEYLMVRRRRGVSGSASALRLFRRVIDGLILFAGLLFTLSHFGVDLTAALAGLGVGGIAVALAAQKTLENIIAGVSLIADQAVRVGDIINLGDVQGTVEEVGLRSTRIRTADRTVVSLPNGQIANMKLETLSARDRILFHPVIGLRYETAPHQLRSAMDGISDLLSEHASVDSATVRVRFVRFGASSLDVDIFAYVFGHDWNNYLKIQEELLLGIMNIVQKAGTDIAFPSQTLYLVTDPSSQQTQAIADHSEKSKARAHH